MNLTNVMNFINFLPRVFAQEKFEYKPPVSVGDTSDIFGNASGWLLSVIGIVAIIMLIIAGIQYATALGDSEKINQAKRTMKYTIFGVILGLLALVIVPMVVNLFQ